VLEAAITMILANKKVHACEMVAERTFSVEEIKKLLGEEEESQPASGAV
jgi:hypothetical protein